MRLCSACLLGINCRYDGKRKPHEKILVLSQNEVLIPICLEQLGGQSTPRPDSEIVGGDGYDVLNNNARVLEQDGRDVTDYFIRGAEEVSRIAKVYNIKQVILKQRSPSCGCGKIYDGTFSKKIISGDGVTTALLKNKGIEVLSEDEF